MATLNISSDKIKGHFVLKESIINTNLTKKKHQKHQNKFKKMTNKSTNRTRTNRVDKCLTHCSRLGWWGLAGLRSGGCWRGWVGSCRRCRRLWACWRLRAARPDFGFGRSSSPSVGVVSLCVRLTWSSSESFRSHIREIWRLISHKQTHTHPRGLANWLRHYARMKVKSAEGVQGGRLWRRAKYNHKTNSRSFFATTKFIFLSSVQMFGLNDACADLDFCTEIKKMFFNAI